MPPINSGSPKIIRSVPYIKSKPIVASNKPKHAEIRPRAKLSPATPAIIVNEKRMSAKNSGGPNRNAKDAINPAKKIKAIFETKSAKQEE